MTRKDLRRRAIFTSLPSAAVALFVTSPAHASSATEGAFGEANDEIIARDRVLAGLVHEARQTLPDREVKLALDMYRDNSTEESLATVERAPASLANVEPMGRACFKVYKWQVVSASWLISAGQSAEKIIFLGKTPWSDILLIMGAPRNSGAAIRKWAKTAAFPKTVCISDEDI